MRRHHRLAYSILGLITFTAFSITLALYLIGTDALRRTIDMREFDRAERTYRMVKTMIDQKIRNLFALSRSLKHNFTLINALEEYINTGNVNSLSTYMKQIYPELDVDIFQVTDSREKVLYRANAPKRNGDTPNIWGVGEALAGEDIILASEGPLGWAVRAVVPARTPKGKIIGSIMIGYRINNRFAEEINMENIGIMIGSLSGLIAEARPHEKHSGGQLLYSEKTMLMSLKENKVYYEKAEGHNTVCYYKRLKIADSMFCMVIELDTSKSRQFLTRTRYRMAGLSAGIFLAALLIGALYSRKLVKPLKELRDQSCETVREITGKTIEQDRGNEIDTLVSAFREMREMLAEHIGKLEQAETELKKHEEQLEQQVDSRTHKLKESNEMLSMEIIERKKTEAELEIIHKELLEASRRAGMAQVATDMLHNIGNVLTSINVITTLVNEKVSCSKISNLEKIVELIREHENDLGDFLTNDAKGKHIPVYLSEVVKFLGDEQKLVLGKLSTLIKNVNHIKEIVGMQQSYAKSSNFKMPVDINELVEDAIQINSAGLERHGVKLKTELANLGIIEIDKQRVLQILVNLINNAKYALTASTKIEKILTIKTFKQDDNILRVEVSDDGIGVEKENLSQIFEYGFTTKTAGHGFGLHSGALAAKEMGGTLTVQSDGHEQGATFILEIPFTPTKGNS